MKSRMWEIYKSGSVRGVDFLTKELNDEYKKRRKSHVYSTLVNRKSSKIKSTEKRVILENPEIVEKLNGRLMKLHDSF